MPRILSARISLAALAAAAALTISLTASSFIESPRTRYFSTVNPLYAELRTRFALSLLGGVDLKFIV